MPASRRLISGVVVFALLGALVFGAYQYQTSRAAVGPTPGGVVINVTAKADRGPGSLREALFVAASAVDKATISIQVSEIVLDTPLPPLVNAHGISISGPAAGVTIDGRALRKGAVFDIAGENVSIQGVTIRNCPGTGVLLRAARFRLTGSAIDGCDVGVDAAENARGFLMEGNKFTNNRIGLRFAASIADAAVVKNEFSGQRDASVWAVRSAADLRNGAISIRDNRFLKDQIGILAGNISIVAERNEFRDARAAAIQLLGEGAVIRGNRVSGGAAMGIVAETSRGAVIENNELDHLTAYGVMIKASSNALVRSNRISNCGYGMAFVLGDLQSPSTAVDNTIIEPTFNGIDVIGESPILRRNHVLNPRARALSVADFKTPDGKTVVSKPFLDNNSFDAASAAPAGAVPAAKPAAAAAKPAAAVVTPR